MTHNSHNLLLLSIFFTNSKIESFIKIQLKNVKPEVKKSKFGFRKKSEIRIYSKFRSPKIGNFNQSITNIETLGVK